MENPLGVENLAKTSYLTQEQSTMPIQEYLCNILDLISSVMDPEKAVIVSLVMVVAVA